MRPIKFRGRDIDTNEEVYFDLENILLDVAGSYSEYVCLHNVEPNSVAQFGDVIDGVEYYEGDERIIDGLTHVGSLTVQWEAQSLRKLYAIGCRGAPLPSPAGSGSA